MVFSLEVNSTNSAMKGSLRSSRISSSRDGPALGEQVRHGYLQSRSETGERRQGRRSLLVLDLGDVGARHAHANGQLPLAQAVAMAQVANRLRHLDLRSTRLFHFHQRFSRCEDWFGFVLIQ